MSHIDGIDSNMRPKSPKQEMLASAKFPDYERYLEIINKAFEVADLIENDRGIPESSKLDAFNNKFSKIYLGAILEQRDFTFRQHLGNIRALQQSLLQLNDVQKETISEFSRDNVNMNGCLEGRIDPVWNYLHESTLIDEKQPKEMNIARVLKSYVDHVIHSFPLNPIDAFLAVKDMLPKETVIRESLLNKAFSAYVKKYEISYKTIEKCFDDYVQDYIVDRLNKMNPFASIPFNPDQAIRAIPEFLVKMKQGFHVFAKKLYRIEKNEPETSSIMASDGIRLSYKI